MSDKLALWLSNKLKACNMSARELGRRIGVSHGHANNIVNGTTIPSAQVCNDIARVLAVPPETVLRMAGHLPPLPEDRQITSEAMALFRELPEYDQENILEQIRAVYRRRVNRDTAPDPTG